MNARITITDITTLIITSSLLIARILPNIYWLTSFVRPAFDETRIPIARAVVEKSAIAESPCS